LDCFHDTSPKKAVPSLPTLESRAKGSLPDTRPKPLRLTSCRRTARLSSVPNPGPALPTSPAPRVLRTIGLDQTRLLSHSSAGVAIHLMSGGERTPTRRPCHGWGR